MESHLDDLGDKGNDIIKLPHIHIEVVQLIAQGLAGQDLGPLAHGAQAAQIAGGIEGGVRGLREIDLGDVGRGERC